MLKIYSTGCINCLEAVKILHKNKVEFVVIDNQKIVEEVAIKTIGFIPVFEFNDKFYNHAQMKNMINANFDFSDKVTEEVKVENPIEEIVNNVVEEVVIENIDIIEPKIINKKSNRRNNGKRN